MAIASLIFGIISLMGTCLALLPLVQILNYCINLPLAVFGALLGTGHLVRNRGNRDDSHRGVAIAGLVLNVIALVLAVARIVLSVVFGFGVF
jgi:hypothetical protein